MLVANARLAEECNIARSNIIVADNGNIINLQKIRYVDKGFLQIMAVDGLGIGDVGEIVLEIDKFLQRMEFCCYL